MEIINHDKVLKQLEDYKKAEAKKLRSERDEKIELILSKINTEERRKAGYKDLTAPQMLRRVSQAFNSASGDVLFHLYRQCLSFDSFSKGFYYLTRNTKPSKIRK